ncbi:MAG: nuclear transport factor 2 family protein [Paracoccaceae bacterium]|nr:nuclear transport factor 2 family protein [Paracoccaceae bacterium]
MLANEGISLVEAYFSAVDGEDLKGVLKTLSEDCVFTVETHGVRLNGHAEIAGMFQRLWNMHRAVRHFSFVHVADPGRGRIASRFQVENTERDGSLVHKSNCNFFEITNGKFSSIAVYMAGPNTLQRATS